MIKLLWSIKRKTSFQDTRKKGLNSVFYSRPRKCETARILVFCFFFNDPRVQKNHRLGPRRRCVSTGVKISKRRRWRIWGDQNSRKGTLRLLGRCEAVAEGTVHPQMWICRGVRCDTVRSSHAGSHTRTFFLHVHAEPKCHSGAWRLFTASACSLVRGCSGKF